MNLITHSCRDSTAFKFREIAHYTTNIYGVFPELTTAQCYEMMQTQQSLQRLVLTKKYREDLNRQLHVIISQLDVTQQGCIWFSFHMGPYHLLPHLLIRLNVKLYVLVSQQVYDDYSQELSLTQYSENIRLINVQDKAAIWHINYALKSGLQLLVYLDGNMGVGQQLKHSIQFPLGDRWWSLSSVLATLAQYHQIPVVPIWLLVKPDEGIQLKLGKMQIITDATVFLQDLFLQFYHDLLCYPAQWKGWLFVHHDIRSTPIKLENTNTPHSYPEFIPYPISDQYFLLERATGLFYPVDALLYQHIMRKMKTELNLNFELF
ncbi:hypothetical protein [Sphingobacterium sp. UDSM-2020]|uniref:hypothetical protein n=1 Tax=Sphingobacterium sp. UDSM-2020 TaxID=2795738 RepID=UPI001934C3B0|nr:hypothetical protein [Sphingobacterium sp. UDSM-2020]QQD15431.1 hypothetical protein JAZ75_07930 [Sphingobacterium sp. UDSM-2020]